MGTVVNLHERMGIVANARWCCAFLRTVRTKTHKLVYDYQSQTGEMYDLENDPHELNNIYDDPNVANIQGALFAMLEQRPEDIHPMEPKSGWRKSMTCRYCGRLSLLILPPSTR